jgi:hypothetical protein
MSSGDRPARRHDRGARRPADPQRRRCRARIAEPGDAGQRQQPVPRRAEGDAAARDADGRTARLPSIRAIRETLPGGRSYTVLDQVDGPADDFAGHRPGRPFFLMGDNRDDSLDSRFRPSEGGVGLCRSKISSAALVAFWSTDGSANGSSPGPGSRRAREPHRQPIDGGAMSDPSPPSSATLGHRAEADLGLFERALTHSASARQL